MTATRDAFNALGGYACPAGALWVAFGDGPPAELAALGEQIRRSNRAAVLRTRARWHRVVPVPGAADCVDRPWAQFERQPATPPSDLLHPGYGVVPYLFRDEPVAAAVRWCEDTDGPGAAFAVDRVTSAGGSGKTRFAIELCQRMAAAGWIAGWRRPGGDTQVAEIGLPRLVVVDYAEAEEPEDLRRVLDELRRNASDLAPVRVLLLGRSGADGSGDPLPAVRAEAGAPLRPALDRSQGDDTVTAHLAIAQRNELFTAAMDHFRAAWWPGAVADGTTMMDGTPSTAARTPQSGSSSASETTTPAALAADRYELALEVLFEAFDRVLSGPQWTPGGRPPVDRALDHERRYWRTTASTGLGVGEAVREWSVGLATLAGAVTEPDADRLLSILPPLADVAAERAGLTA